MKKVYLSVLITGLTTLVQSQVIINASDFNGAIGESFDYNQTNYISPGSPGASQTWDLSGMATSATSTVNHNAANGSFPTTNITYQDVVAGSELYYDFSNTAQVIHGMMAGTTLITYSNPQTHMGYPISMGVSGSDTHLASFTSSGYAFSRAGSTTWEGDGYGTVITPHGTFNDVLRVKITQTYTDTYSLGTIDYSVVIYLWIKAGIHFPIASVTSYTYDMGGGPTSQSYGTYATGNLGLSEFNNDVEFAAFPNPANDIFQIKSSEMISSVIISDLTGKLIKEVESTNVDISDLSGGMYLVSVKTNDGTVSQSQRIVKL